jgi:hypothetical protein
MFHIENVIYFFSIFFLGIGLIKKNKWLILLGFSYTFFLLIAAFVKMIRDYVL